MINFVTRRSTRYLDGKGHTRWPVLWPRLSEDKTLPPRQAVNVRALREELDTAHELRKMDRSTR
jgi:hypothetical protein